MLEFRRITGRAEAWWLKPLNAMNGTTRYLMRGGEVPYQYKGRVVVKAAEAEQFIAEHRARILEDLSDLQQKVREKNGKGQVQIQVIREELGTTRVVKGVRGALRHSIMTILHKHGISYCSPTRKEKFQGSDEPTLLEGEHLTGACKDEPCPVRQLFGMMGEESPIRVWSDVLIQTDKPLSKIIKQRGYAFVYVSTEKRHQARRDGKALQDFSEQYFSGEFQFYIEFSRKLPAWLLGLLVEGILGITAIGGGKNSGYSRVKITELQLEKVRWERALGEEKNGKLTILEREETTNSNKELVEGQKAWQKYLQTVKNS